jgi:hypothetical protein
MEHAEVSRHEVTVYLFLRSHPDEWFSNADIAKQSQSVLRTVRSYTLKFVKLGLLDQAELFPSHRYRWSNKADKRNKSYSQRLQHAAEIFGLSATNQKE